MRIENKGSLIDWDNFEEIETSLLIEFISWKGEGDSETEEASQKAGAIFFDRFRKDLTQKCEILCKRWNHSIEVSTLLVQRTFQKFFRRNSFNFEDSNCSDYDMAVRLYLYSIASNELTNYYREVNGLRAPKYSGEEKIVREIDDLDIFAGKVEPRRGIKKEVEANSTCFKLLQLETETYLFNIHECRCRQGRVPAKTPF